VWHGRDLCWQDVLTQHSSSSLCLGSSSSNQHHKKTAYDTYSTDICYPFHMHTLKFLFNLLSFLRLGQISQNITSRVNSSQFLQANALLGHSINSLSGKLPFGFFSYSKDTILLLKNGAPADSKQDHHRVISASPQLPSHLRRPQECPHTTWLRKIDADV